MTPAILVRRIRLTESSLILTWLTEEAGLLKTVAKGALRPKNRLAGILDLFHLCEISVQPARSGPLHSLREASLLLAPSAPRVDPLRLALAAYAVELLEKATEPETPVPELYDLMKRALLYLEREPASMRALLHFESELARLLGIASAPGNAHLDLERVLHRLPVSRGDLVARLSAARLSS